ncbi:hypothetical protein Syun_024229 [Stephania yunnanensis]|uniref:Uncharacterized protein n=1 Tax=Stephania yunnanensis TaxID=152371 RepID=A0AAP0NI67_9MAGN
MALTKGGKNDGGSDQVVVMVVVVGSGVDEVGAGLGAAHGSGGAVVGAGGLLGGVEGAEPPPLLRLGVAYLRRVPPPWAAPDASIPHVVSAAASSSISVSSTTAADPSTRRGLPQRPLVVGIAPSLTTTSTTTNTNELLGRL